MKTVVISTRKLPTLGTVLVNGKGRTLYMFVPDKRTKSRASPAAP
jgi:predicted lipoprotein with Yx(FWY)xxD motif